MTKLPSLDEHGSESDDLTRADGVASRPCSRRIAAQLRSGVRLTEFEFDRFLPYELRVVSSRYWTPLAVAREAARWLDDLHVRTVVDIGSGAGKFCVAGALVANCQFTGLEQRPRLVAAARALARSFGVGDRVSFVEGALGEVAVPPAEAYYLYNPFEENVSGPAQHLDDDVELSDLRFESDVARVERLLRRAPVGTYVLTYNGFGGHVPELYDEVRGDLELPHVLRMWRKQRNLSAASSGTP